MEDRHPLVPRRVHDNCRDCLTMMNLDDKGVLRQGPVERSSIYAVDMVKPLLEQYDVRYCSLW